MSKIIKLASVVALVSCASFVARSGDVTDDLLFDLGLSGTFTPSDASTFGSVFDAAHWSAATRPIVTSANAYQVTGELGEIVPQPIAITEETVTSATFKTQPWTQKCLTFPKNMTAGDGVVSNIFPSLVAMPAIDTGDRQPFTVFLRFRWDGNSRGVREQFIVDNARRDKDQGFRGWGIGAFFSNSGTSADVDKLTSVRVYVRGANSGEHTLQAPKGSWVELAVAFQDNGDGASTTATVVSHVLNADGTSAFVSKSYSINKTVEYFRNSQTKIIRNPLVLGGQCEYVYSSGTATWLPSTSTASEFANIQPGSTFCGSIATFRVYGRAFSVEEMSSLFWDAAGAEIAIGSTNSSSEEFASDSDADAASVYDPTTQPAWRMRGELTAAHPTLTLQFPLKEEEVGLPRYLTVVPVHKGTGERVPVRLSVNDIEIGTLNVAGNAPVDFPIRKNRVTRTADGKIKLELTRIDDLTGTLGIDALQFGGSWAFGKADGQRTDWCFLQTTTTPPETPQTLSSWIGVPQGRKFLWDTIRSVHKDGKSYSYPAETIHLSLPASAVSLPATYEVKFSTVSANSVIDFYLNGAKFGESLTGLSAANWVKLDIPADTFVTGLNTLTISNASPVTAIITGNTYDNVRFDAHRFTVQNPRSLQGMMLIFR